MEGSSFSCFSTSLVRVSPSVSRSGPCWDLRLISTVFGSRKSRFCSRSSRDDIRDALPSRQLFVIHVFPRTGKKRSAEIPCTISRALAQGSRRRIPVPLVLFLSHAVHLAEPRSDWRCFAQRHRRLSSSSNVSSEKLLPVLVSFRWVHRIVFRSSRSSSTLRSTAERCARRGSAET